MGGGGTTQSTQQQTTMQLPPWVNEAAQQNYAFAQNVANRPLVQYQGKQVADAGPASMQSWDLAQTAGPTGKNYYDPAQAGYMGILASGAPSIRAGSLASTSLSPYMNPYTKDVINTSLDIMNQNLARQLQTSASKASQAGAFGGSRQALEDAITKSQTNMQAGQLAAGLNQSNFGQAQTAAMQDIATQLDAAKSNQSAELQNRNLGILAAGGLSGLGEQANRNLITQYGLLSQAGQEQKSQAQQIIDAQMGKFNQAWQYPNDQLNTLLAALGMTPYEKSQTSTGQTETKSSPDLAMSGLGMLSILGGLFKSDVRAKKDVQQVGSDPGSKLPMYSFRYKGDQGSSKFVGPLAQDVERKFPGSTVNVGGTKFIKGSQAVHRGIPLPHPAGILAGRRRPRVGVL